VTSHWIDVHLFGTDPASCMCTAWRLAFSPSCWSTPSAAVWAKVSGDGAVGLHPLHVEVFAYVSARSDLLAGIFSLSHSWSRSNVCAQTARPSGWPLLWRRLASLSRSSPRKPSGVARGVLPACLAIDTGERPSCLRLPCWLRADLFPLRRLLMESTALPMAQWKPMLRALADSPELYQERMRKAEQVALGRLCSTPRRFWPSSFTSPAWKLSMRSCGARCSHGESGGGS